MPDGFTNRPKILRGAFVEYGLSLPPLVLPFQFNPEQITRTRTLSFDDPNSGVYAPGQAETTGEETQTRGSQTRGIERSSRTLWDYHNEEKDLLAIRDGQVVTIQEESISFEIRLDATDKLNEGDPITEQFGLSPQLSTLELMVHPKSENLLGQLLSAISTEKGFSFTKRVNPPMILFIWGRKRVLPVNIDSMNITETEFSTDLNPVRATVSVTLTVIEGKNIPYMYTRRMKEAMSILNLANLTSITDVIIPG